MMKRIITPIVLFVFALTLNAQSSIDRLFDRYQGADGFVTVTVSGNFLKLAGAFDDDDEFLKHADKFTSIRILAQEDDDVVVENFYDMVMDELTKGGYEEMVRVNSSDTDLKIMVRAEGDIFTEFLLVTGGDDNAIIQIKGRLTEKIMKEIADELEDDDHLFGMR
ncbi:MAG: DUF4252 domain-containing protein [Bacteroidales bacterium]|jgi:hypothetical protein|nr:DUF4252 domain-containing protein [Bacteroidales bacterium]